MSCNLKDEQDLTQVQIGRRVPGREYKSVKKKAALCAGREGGAESGSSCLHLDAGVEGGCEMEQNRVEDL